jgi:hypothetical protein
MILLIEALSILLEFYSAQDQTTYPYLASITAVGVQITLPLSLVDYSFRYLLLSDGETEARSL